MSSDGVLILSHCGFSFAEDLVAACRARGLNAWILTSMPLPPSAETRLDTLRDLADDVIVSTTHELRMGDIEHAAISLREQGRNIVGCISVWEGYRGLMAYGNGRLNVADLPWGALDLLRDKLWVRRTLRTAGLTQVDAQALTPALLDALKQDDGTYFVKPIRGIASYGAFRLTAHTTWATLDAIAEQARQDAVYTSVLGERLDYMVEPYVSGTEYSFEVLAVEGKHFVVGIHEKCQLTECDGTVLEDSCTSPPVSLVRDQIAAGLVWIDAVARQLKLDWGCFHIEARFDGRHWELIEVNPRVGGSLISHSVKALNRRASALDLWLDQLVLQSAGKPSPEYLRLLAELSYAADGTPPTEDATFFRVYFASPGCIESIRLKETDPQPVMSQILLKVGDKVEAKAREVFLGQILWHMPRGRRDRELARLLDISAAAVDVRYTAESREGTGMIDQIPILLIIDYNLTRVADVATIARHARERHRADTLLIRASPGAYEREICEYLIDLDPLDPHFVDKALAQLEPFAGRVRAGVVFSDNAVQSGAELLERLRLPTDSASLAEAAISKRAYREREQEIRDLLEAQSVMVPDSTNVTSVDDLYRFAAEHPEGFVLKPSCEGNNRGVVVVCDDDDFEQAFALVAPYLANGALCEERIPFRREFSFDGVGEAEFVTEKVNADGRFPVEIAQILPARLTEVEHTTLTRTGRLANLIVGQRCGAFHNEIRLSDDGHRAAVVEPNRRPAGMKIWTLARAVYGVDFYGHWVDVAFGGTQQVTVEPASTEAATVMLGVPADGRHMPPSDDDAQALLRETLRRTEAVCGIVPGSIGVLEYAWLSSEARYIPAIPRDNADFAAVVCIALDRGDAEIRHLVQVLRKTWVAVLAEVLEREAGVDVRQLSDVT